MELEKNTNERRYNLMTTIQYISGLLTFYFKGKISRDDNFVYLSNPKIFMGLFPMRKTKQQFMLNQIVSTSSGFHLLYTDLIISLLELVFGILVCNATLLGLILVFISIATFINAFKTTLTIHLSSGKKVTICFSVLESKQEDRTITMISTTTFAEHPNHKSNS